MNCDNESKRGTKLNGKACDVHSYKGQGIGKSRDCPRPEGMLHKID